MVELSSLVSHRVASGELSASEGETVRRELDRMLRESFELLSPSAADFAAAAKYLGKPKTGLRAGDALHLAIAASHRAKKILTLDARIIAAGKVLKLPVSRGIKA
jgi:predicted nucleic acid-binding protein